MSEWQPIETAPRDWSDVLVFSPEHEGLNFSGVFSAFYDTDDEEWCSGTGGGNLILNPTHWMPLPAPPNA